MADGLVPRITVPDDGDWATVVAALIDYQVGLWTRVRVVQGGLLDTLTECQKACDLLRVLAEQAEAEAVQRRFGEIPDDLSRLDGGLEP